MAYWAGHSWTYDVERTDELVTSVPEIDWQRHAPGLGDREGRSWRDHALDGWD